MDDYLISYYPLNNGSHIYKVNNNVNLIENKLSLSIEYYITDNKKMLKIYVVIAIRRLTVKIIKHF